jgi:DNA double-strand break repair helicase HerA and related ATPase
MTAFTDMLAAGFTGDEPGLTLGRRSRDLRCTSNQDPAALGMTNRQGLIARATGTGKAKTLQLLAEQLSALVVPVFARRSRR